MYESVTNVLNDEGGKPAAVTCNDHHHKLKATDVLFLIQFSLI